MRLTSHPLPGLCSSALDARLAESNIQGIVKEVVQLYNSEGRRAVTSAVAGQILTVCCGD